MQKYAAGMGTPDHTYSVFWPYIASRCCTRDRGSSTCAMGESALTEGLRPSPGTADKADGLGAASGPDDSKCSALPALFWPEWWDLTSPGTYRPVSMEF